jgi:DNA polymerase beta
MAASHNYKIQLIEELNFWIHTKQNLKKKDTEIKHDYKIAAYKKVLNQILRIKTIKSWEDLKNVKGIGKSIRSKLESVFEKHTTSNKYLYNDDIEKIYGVGPAKALQLMKNYNILTVEDLHQANSKNPDLLNRVQKIGLKYYDDLQQPISRKEMDAHSKWLDGLLHTENPLFSDLISSLVGSYRREANQSSDIDLLLSVQRSTTPKERANILHSFVEILKHHNYIIEVLSLGDKKFMGIVRLPSPKYKHFRRMDILITSQKEYPFALLYFTGSKEFNIEFRKNARLHKVVLNEHGIFDDKKNRLNLDIRSEIDIFNYFNVPYINPKHRN